MFFAFITEVFVHADSISWPEARPGNFQTSPSSNIPNLRRWIACNIPSPTNPDIIEKRTTACYAAMQNNEIEHFKTQLKSLIFISLQWAPAKVPRVLAGCPPQRWGRLKAAGTGLVQQRSSCSWKLICKGITSDSFTH